MKRIELEACDRNSVEPNLTAIGIAHARREREEERRGRTREEPAGETRHLAGAGCAGAAGLGEKSTLGGSAIAFSFSTVKLAFSL